MVIPELVFNIYDDDRLDIPPSKSELLEKISFVVYLITADNFTSTPQLQIGNITSNKSRSVSTSLGTRFLKWSENTTDRHYFCTMDINLPHKVAENIVQNVE